MKNKNLVFMCITLFVVSVLLNSGAYFSWENFNLYVMVFSFIILIIVDIPLCRLFEDLAQNKDDVYFLRKELYDLLKKNDEKVYDIEKKLVEKYKNERIEHIKMYLRLYSSCLKEYKEIDPFNFFDNVELDKKIRKLLKNLIKHYETDKYSIVSLREQYETKNLITRKNGALNTFVTALSISVSILGLWGISLFSKIEPYRYITIGIFVCLLICFETVTYIEKRREYKAYYQFQINEINSILKEI